MALAAIRPDRDDRDDTARTGAALSACQATLAYGAA